LAEIDNIVQINISRESTPVATASFQIPLILSTFTNFAERTREYTDFDAVASDFDSTDKVYQIAQRIFGQTAGIRFRIPKIVVGRRQVNEVTIVPVVSDNTLYRVTINEVDYTFTSGTGATATTITAGLDTAIGTPTGINASATGGVLTVGSATPGANWSIRTSSNLTVTYTAPTETWVEALDAVSEDNNDWYALVAESHADADIKSLAETIQTRRKIFGTSTQDTAVPTAATTDVGSYLSDTGLERTFITYLPTANTQYPEAAWIGSQLAATPGSNDWDKKQGSLITVSKLTDTQRANLREKNVNMFTKVAGVNIFQDGNTCKGSPIDEVIFIDWLYARLQEGIYFRLINSPKILMTDPGLVSIENEIRSVLSLAQANGAIDAGWTVQTPSVLSIPENQRAQRIAGTFKFRARLAGSVRKVVVEGTLSV